jgi:hypothetical protein
MLYQWLFYRNMSLTSVSSADLSDDPDEEVVQLDNEPRPNTGSTAIRRRSGMLFFIFKIIYSLVTNVIFKYLGQRRSRTKIKRRCSINGHFYNRETSFFLPPHGSQMSVWVTSLVSTTEVINLILEKYRVDSHVGNFALYVVHDNGGIQNTNF